MYRTYEELPKVKFPSNVDEINICDSTLLHASRMPGINIKKENKITMYEYLHKIGVEATEVYLYPKIDQGAIDEISDFGCDKPKLIGSITAKKEDIDLATKKDVISELLISLPISDTRIKYHLKKDKDDISDFYLDLFDYAQDHGFDVRISLEDLTRSDIKKVVKPFVKKIIKEKNDTIIRISDLMDYGVPFEKSDFPYSIPKLIKSFKNWDVENIEIHTHDDYGMGFVNTLSALWHGANWAAMTFLGVGERAGTSALESLLLFLKYRTDNLGDKYNLKYITDFADYMESDLGLVIPGNKAVVGKNIFSHESGIHTAGVIKNPFAYEPYPPELVGGKRKLIVGDSSGADVVRIKVEEILKKKMDIDTKLDKRDKRIVSICRDIQTLYDREGRRSAISDEELQNYVKKYFLYEKEES